MAFFDGRVVVICLQFSENKIILYGAGYCGAMFAELLQEKEINIECFFDRNPQKAGKKIMDIIVKEPCEMEMADEYTVVVCLLKKGETYKSIKESLEQLGYVNVIHVYDLREDKDLFKNQNLIISPDIEKVKLNAKKYEWLKTMLEDEESKETLQAILNYMLEGGEFALQSHSLEEQYFAYDVYQKIENEVVIDCGAFKGDVMEIFLHKNPQFVKYVAIEPDFHYHGALEEKRNLCEKDKIEIIPLALSNQEEMLKMTNYANEDSVVKENGKIEVRATTLDSLAEKLPVTILKIDVEGYEQKVLEGAKIIIKKYLPVIAVATYHKEEDFYEICEKIHQLSKEYSFYLRSYMNLQETVLYAVPRWRSIGGKLENEVCE